MMKFAPLLAAALTLAAPLAHAADIKAGSLVISGPWSRETAPRAKTGAGYVTITNTGKTADRLLGGATPAAGKLEVHAATHENGVMRMRPQKEGVVIPAGGTLELKPGGYHIMFIDLKAPLKVGETVPVTLHFAKAGKVQVSFDVQSLRGTPAPANHDQHNGHGQMNHDHGHH